MLSAMKFNSQIQSHLQERMESVLKVAFGAQVSSKMNM